MKALAIFAVCVISSPRAWAGNCPVGTPRTTVFYVNGVATSNDDTCDGADYSRQLLQAKFSTFPGNHIPPECLDFQLAYNQTADLFLDLLESALQKLGFDPFTFWRAVLGSLTPDPFTQLELDNLSSLDGSSVNTDDLDKHLQLYRDALAAGNQVAVVAHSQGNFYANQAYEKLFNGPNPLKTKKSFGIVAVASPDNHVAGSPTGCSTPLTPVKCDLFTKFLSPFWIADYTTACSAPFTTLNCDIITGVPDSLPADIDNHDSLAPLSRHYFNTSYLAGINSRPKILQDLANVIAGLEPPLVTSTSVAYITNHHRFRNDGTVSVIDTANKTVTATITVGDGPEGVAVAPDEKLVYVANFDAGTFSVIKTADNTVRTFPVGGGPFGIAINPAGTRAYITNFNSNIVSVIDTNTNAVVGTVTVGSGPIGIAVTPDGKRVYVANQNDDTVSVISTNDNSTIDPIVVGVLPTGIAIAPNGEKVYVANFCRNGETCYNLDGSFNGTTVSVIDTLDNTVGTIPLGSGRAGYGITINPAGTRVYVTNYCSDEDFCANADGSRKPGTISIINTVDHTVVNKETIDPFPHGVAVTPDGKQVYIANFTDGTVSVMDAATNTLGSPIRVEDGPVAFGQFIGLIPH